MCEGCFTKSDQDNFNLNLSTEKLKPEIVNAIRGIKGKITFGKLLRAIRIGEKASITQFVSKLKVSETHLRGIEKGERVPTIQRATEWAKILNFQSACFKELIIKERPPKALDPDGMRKCSKCGVVKPYNVDEFYPGHRQCRECLRETKHKYSVSSVRIKAYSKLKKFERRVKLDQLKNKPCVDCGMSFPPALPKNRFS